MGGAVEAQVAGGVGRQLGEDGQGAGHEVVQRPVVQLVGVIAVVVVLEHHLPVPGVPRGRAGAGAVGGGEAVAGDGVLHRGQARGQGRGVHVEVDEDEAQPGLHLEAGQVDLPLVEIAGPLHRRRVHQMAVQAIGPVVVGAQEAARVARAFGHQHAPVLADRRHGHELALAGAGHQDGLADDAGGEVVAGFRHPALAADAEPFVIEHRLFLELVESGVDVAGRGQGLRLGEIAHRAVQAGEEGVIQNGGFQGGGLRKLRRRRAMREMLQAMSKPRFSGASRSG